MYRQLNKAYYDLLRATTRRGYEVDIPFVGAANWAQAAGNPHKAFELALKIREKGKIRRLVVEGLQAQVDAGDRPAFERALARFQAELQDVAASLGVKIDCSRASGQEKAFWKLCKAVVPGEAGDAAEAVVALIPENLKSQVRDIGARLVSPTPLQMLFLDHARSLRPRSI